MYTRSIKKSEIKKEWWVVDVKDKTLGRISSNIAQILRGKHKVNFTPHMDMGDFVVVINADKIKLSGNKSQQKTYFKHSGYPGGARNVSYSEVLSKYPERIIQNSVKGMLPHNKLGRKIFHNLKVYKGSIHPHGAQTPKILKF